MTDSIDDPAYWRHRAANVRAEAQALQECLPKRLLLQIAERFELIAGVVERRGALSVFLRHSGPPARTAAAGAALPDAAAPPRDGKTC
jgi:hypothetical protein